MTTATSHPSVDRHRAELVRIDSLKPYPGNARTHDLELIRQSLRANGQYRPVVVRSRTREVLAGNGTREAALAEEWTDLWATFVDCDAKTARRINLIDNRANDSAGYDEEALTRALQSLEGNYEGTGYDQKVLDRLLAEADVDTNPQLGDIEYRIVILCDGEGHQAELLGRLEAEGLQVQALAQ